MTRSSISHKSMLSSAGMAAFVIFWARRLAGCRISGVMSGVPAGVMLSAIFGTIFGGLMISPGLALPPPEDMPEEVLRNELLFEARSPIDGQPLTAAEYARLQAELAASEQPPPVDPTLQQYVFLLRILKMVRILTPL